MTFMIAVTARDAAMTVTENGRTRMSWYSDKERCNEYDDPYCIWKSKVSGGKCGNSKAECDRCMRSVNKCV